MSVPTFPPGIIPLNYKEVLYWKVTQNNWRVLILNIMGLPLGIIMGAIFFIFLFQLGRPPIVKSDDLDPFLIFTLIGTAMIFLVHEWVHGLAMQLYGARPKYGIIWKGLMLYATSPGFAYQRNQYLVVILAPLVILSLLACLGILLLAGSPIVWMVPVYAVVNGSGSIGDVWMSLIVLRYPSHAYVLDERAGMRIFLPTN